MFLIGTSAQWSIMSVIIPPLASYLSMTIPLLKTTGSFLPPSHTHHIIK